MKKHIYIISAVAALCASCQIASLEPVETPSKAGFTKTFTATMGGDSKVTIKDANHLIWEQYDQILVLDPVGTMTTNSGKEIMRYEPTIFEMNSLVGNTATFTGTLTMQQEKYFALYPADLSNIWFNSEIMWIERQVSTRQTLNADTGIDGSAITMLGEGSSSLQFTLVDGLLNFRLEQTSATIDHLRFSFPGCKVFGGPVRIELPSGKSTIDGSYDMMDQLDVYVGYPTHMTSFESGKDYYISVPVGIYGPIKIEAISRLADGSEITLGSISSANTIEVRKNTVNTLGTLEFYDESNKTYNLSAWKQATSEEISATCAEAESEAASISARLDAIRSRDAYRQMLINAILADDSVITKKQGLALEEARAFNFDVMAEDILSFVAQADTIKNEAEDFKGFLGRVTNSATWPVLVRVTTMKAEIIKKIKEYITNCAFYRIYNVDFLESRLESVIATLEKNFPGISFVDMTAWKQAFKENIAVAMARSAYYSQEENNEFHQMRMMLEEASARLYAYVPSSDADAAQVAQLRANIDYLNALLATANQQSAAEQAGIDMSFAALAAQVEMIGDYLSHDEYEQVNQQYNQNLESIAASVESKHDAAMKRIMDTAMQIAVLNEQIRALIG